MGDDDEGLAAGVDAGAVEAVAGDDGDIGREVLLERSNLGSFAGGLSADNGADLSGRTVFRDDSGDEFGFDGVDYVVADAGYEVAVAEDGQVGVGSGLVRLDGSFHEEE